jgi:hypothetical protein
MKTISEYLSERRAEKVKAACMIVASVCLAILVACFTVAVVVKTARIVADTEARCEAREPICAGPEW